MTKEKKSQSKRVSSFKEKNKGYIAAKASKASGKGSAFTKSKASSNPTRPDPSGGKAGS